MTAELCDNFKSKKHGAIEIFKLCKKIKHQLFILYQRKKKSSQKISEKTIKILFQ